MSVLIVLIIKKKFMMKLKLIKTILIPTIGITAIGTIAAVLTSCSCSPQPTPTPPVVPAICVTANADSRLELKNAGENNPNLQYSVDGKNWTTYSEKLYIPENEKIYLIGDNANGWSLSEKTYSIFNITGNVSISGNVMSLLDNGTGTTSSIPNDYCFYKLFDNSEGITSVSEDFLPSKSLKKSCYIDMFNGCTSLTTAPALPATTLAEACYSGMFANCASLTTAPALPATTLATDCYSSMFSDCTSLIAAPDLPIRTLAEGCYAYMFAGCSSLTTAPTLPATTLAESCYLGMFAICTSLKTAPDLPATELATACYSSMFEDCTSLTTAPALPATILANSCYSSMFYGCTLLASVRIGYAGTRTQAPEGAFDNWVSNVASVGTFYYTGTDPDPITNFGFPSGWTINHN